MNKIYKTLIFSLFFIAISYSQTNIIEIGDTIHKKIRLSFNEEAVKQKEYLIFKTNDDFDFENLELLIDGKKHTENTFKVYASKKEVIKKIDFYLKENAKSGVYSFSARLEEASNNLSKNGNIKYKGSKEFKKWEGKLPKPKWITTIIYSIIGLALLLIAFFFYKKSITFGRGTVHLIEPINQNYKLTGKTSFDSVKEKCCIETEISFVLKKAKNGKIKIVDKSAKTVVFINDKLTTRNAIVGKNHTVKLVKDNKVIKFKYL